MIKPVDASLPLSQQIPAACAQIPDFPKEGILFYDVTTLFANPQVFRASMEEIAHLFEGQFDIVAGVEARGFLMASAIAYIAGTGVMTVRKAGKLPRDTYLKEYALEYGSAAIEIHKDDIPAGTRVLLVDDLLATGGTLDAATNLMQMADLDVAGIATLLEIDGLGGRELLAGHRVEALAQVSE